MKPEDWANLQVGASAALCSVGVLWAPPGPVWAGGPLARECRRATPAPTHTHTHARSPGHACEPVHAVALPPVTNVHSSGSSSGFPSTFPSSGTSEAPWVTPHTHSGAAHGRAPSPLTLTRSHTRSIHAHAPTACHSRSHTRALLAPADTLCAPSSRMRTCVLLRVALCGCHGCTSL